MKTEEIRKEIVKKIDEYLGGKISEKEATEWALGIIKEHVIPNDEIEIHSALGDLVCLDEPERYQTAKEDLIWQRDRLMGNKTSKLPKGEGQ